jgi:hypothetical protein
MVLETSWDPRFLPKSWQWITWSWITEPLFSRTEIKGGMIPTTYVICEWKRKRDTTAVNTQDITLSWFTWTVVFEYIIRITFVENHIWLTYHHSKFGTVITLTSTALYPPTFNHLQSRDCIIRWSRRTRCPIGRGSNLCFQLRGHRHGLVSESFFLINSACNLITTDGSYNIVNIGVGPKCAVKGLWRDRYLAWYHLVNTSLGAELTK